MTMRVTIKDRDALMALTIKQIKTYIESKGWYKKDDYVRNLASGERILAAEIWSQDICPATTTAILIPLNEQVIDYAARISELIIHLEQKENRSQLEIYADISRKSISIRPKKNSKKR